VGGPAIVIFGAAVRADGTPSAALCRRVEAALACGRSLSGVLFVPTGGVGRYGPAEADVMAELLRRHGVPDAQILREPSGTDTLSSVRAVRRLLRGVHTPVYVATSAYHLPRCILLLRMAGLPARPCPPPAAPAARTFHRRWYWRLREGLALPLDAAWLAILRLSGRI
jgi:uncharacterized SAM-binding protein YcdF (DUF218 family)